MGPQSSWAAADLQAYPLGLPLPLLGTLHAASLHRDANTTDKQTDRCTWGLSPEKVVMWVNRLDGPAALDAHYTIRSSGVLTGEKSELICPSR